jgi:hypothetical protein
MTRSIDWATTEASFVRRMGGFIEHFGAADKSPPMRT